MTATQIQQKLDELQSHDSIRQSLIKKYQTYGYVIKPGDIFYKVIAREDDKEVWGLKVGTLQHQCHIDFSEFIVLFFPDRKIEFQSFADIWLIDVIRV